MISLPGVEDSVWYLTVLLKTSAGEQEVGEAVGLTHYADQKSCLGMLRPRQKCIGHVFQPTAKDETRQILQSGASLQVLE